MYYAQPPEVVTNGIISDGSPSNSPSKPSSGLSLGNVAPIAVNLATGNLTGAVLQTLPYVVPSTNIPSTSPAYIPEIIGVPENQMGVWVQVQKGDSLVSAIKRATGVKPGKQQMLAVIKDAHNAHIKTTTKYGYKENFGMAGPMLSDNYSGKETTYGSGNQFPWLYVPRIN